MDGKRGRITGISAGYWASRLMCWLLLLGAFAAQAQVKNGFDLSSALLPADEIVSGGPPRDGIPSIDAPKFVNAKQADFLRPGDRVLGLARNGVAKAYPIKILNWHEIVNDEIRGEAVAVTYCPLCGTGTAYPTRAAGKRLSFGVSGLLYNSDVLLYDRQTQSLWSQLLSQAISGPLKGAKLALLAIDHTTWEDWRKRHPRTLVLSTATGFARDYNRNPYAAYEQSRDLWFEVKHENARFHPKELVLGVEIDGQFKAYPFSELAKTRGEISDTFAGQTLTVRYDAAHKTGTVLDQAGRVLPAITAFWFAWYAFHPQTQVFIGSFE